MVYLFYIDESGTPDRKFCPPEGRRNIFSLVAVGMLDHKWPGFNYTMCKYKRGIYEQDSKNSPDSLGIKDYEIKSSSLRHPQMREKSPLLRALSLASLKELAMQYYKQLDYHTMTLLGVVIDVARLPDNYGNHEIQNKAMELLYEQIDVFMWKSHPRHKAIVIADEYEQTANYRLATQHAQFLRTKTTAKIQLRRIVETPLFIRSELSEGIQLADLCAYNVYRAFANDDMEYSYFQKILPYFHRFPGAESDIASIIKVFPDTNDRFPRLI